MHRLEPDLRVDTLDQFVTGILSLSAFLVCRRRLLLQPLRGEQVPIVERRERLDIGQGELGFGGDRRQRVLKLTVER